MESRKYVDINELLIWSDNPRHGLQVEDSIDLTEIDIINILIDVVGADKMYNLLQDIFSSKKLMENVIPVVVSNGNKYLVYDGNRRISVLKILLNPNIVEDNDLRQRIIHLVDGADVSFANRVFVCVTDRENALELMDKMHSGEQDGVGMIPWESYQRDISLNSRNKPVKYPYAFRVSNALKYQKKSHFKIPYTDLDRLFGSLRFQECFSLSVCSDDEFVKNASYAIDMLQKYKNHKHFKSFSREFNTTNASSDNAAMAQFCKWVKELAKEKDSIHFEMIAVELFQNQKFSFEQMKLRIYGSDRNEITYQERDVQISYLSPNGVETNAVDTSCCGKWEVHIEHQGAKHTGSVLIKELLRPKVEFLNSCDSVRVGNTLNLRDVVVRATDGYGQDRKADMHISALGETKIVGDILAGDNPVGNATICFTFCDVTGEPFSTTKDFAILDQNTPLVAANRSYALLSFSTNVTIDISEVVNQLINEINALDFESNICLITSSLRTLIELSFDELAARNIITFSKKADLCLSIEEFKQFLLNNGLSNLCAKYSTILVSFKNEKNAVTLFSPSEISSLLNLGAHKSIARIDKAQIRDKAKTFVVPVLIYTTLLLK